MQHLSNQALQELGKKFGTPLYVYNGDLILQRLREVSELVKLPKLKIFYAMKANYNPHILRLLLQAGACIDAVSPGDVLLAKRCGFPAERILYTSNNITDQEMAEVNALGVLFNIDSLSRMEKFGRAFPGSEVCLRFNPDVVAGAHQYIQTGGDLTKFGILLEDVEKALEIAARHELKIVGIHKHTGSGIKDIDKYINAIENLLALASVQRFPNLRFVDFGGGLSVPYMPDEARIDYEMLGQRIGALLGNFCKTFGREVELYFEPGKFLIAEAGYLVVQVNTLKNNRGRLIAGTNSGFPQLIRPVLYQAYHHVLNLSNPAGPLRKHDICGNICETGDTFATDRPIAEIREGDFLAIQNAGAYCYSMGGVYNLRAMPAEVLVIQGESRLIRKRQSNLELVESILKESDFDFD